MELAALILTTLYWALPGFMANMAPILFRDRIRWLAIPVDMGIRIGGKPIFGSHKTIRGFVVGILAAALTAVIQSYLYSIGIGRTISYIDYHLACGICIGITIGFGALFGDLVKSFIKRRLDLREGTPFVPWDQVDYAIGMIVFSGLVLPMTLAMMVTLLISAPTLSIIVTRIAFHLKIRKEKW
jgi:CDP-2,3-bis-(O-geranylgeranyl)-sn-glycerol synthase